jgi:hypothetical protein
MVTYLQIVVTLRVRRAPLNAFFYIFFMIIKGHLTAYGPTFCIHVPGLGGRCGTLGHRPTLVPRHVGDCHVSMNIPAEIAQRSVFGYVSGLRETVLNPRRRLTAQLRRGHDKEALPTWVPIDKGNDA